MTALWITLGVVGYMASCVVAAYVMSRLMKDETMCAFSPIWPLALWAVLIIWAGDKGAKR